MKTFKLEVTEEELTTISLGLSEYRNWLDKCKAAAPENAAYFDDQATAAEALKERLILQTVGQYPIL